MPGHVLCIGELLVDCLADQPGPRPSVRSWTAHPGGAPANVACALARLGTPAAFIGCVGDDDAGRQAARLLHDTGVDTSGLQWHPEAPTRRVAVLRTEDGDRIFAGFAGADEATTGYADTHLDADRLPAQLFQDAAFLVLGTLGLAHAGSRASLLRAVALAAARNVPVLLDINWRPVFWPEPALAPQQIAPLLDRIQYLKLSEEEAGWLLGTTDPEAIAARHPSLRGVLVTRGARGCAYQLGQHRGVVPSWPVPVVDTTGAGDSFVAGFLHALLQHGEQRLAAPAIVRAIVAHACAAGALTTTRPGAIGAQPTAAEVNALLQTPAASLA